MRPKRNSKRRAPTPRPDKNMPLKELWQEWGYYGKVLQNKEIPSIESCDFLVRPRYIRKHDKSEFITITPYPVQMQIMDKWLEIEEFLSLPHQIPLVQNLEEILVKSDDHGLHLYLHLRQSSPAQGRAQKRFFSFLEQQDYIAGAGMLSSSPFQAYQLQPGPQNTRHTLRTSLGSQWLNRSGYKLHPLEKSMPISVLQSISETLQKWTPKAASLLHLYGGSGLLSRFSDNHFTETHVVDLRKQAHLAFNRLKTPSMHFIQKNIKAEWLIPFLAEHRECTSVLITNSAKIPTYVIRALSEDSPRRIFRLYTQSEILEQEPRKWKNLEFLVHRLQSFTIEGYNKERIVLVEYRPDVRGALQKKNRKQSKKPKIQSDTPEISFEQ
jgi:hypothetical protein